MLSLDFISSKFEDYTTYDLNGIQRYKNKKQKKIIHEITIQAFLIK